MSTTEVPRPRTEAPAADPAAAPRTRRARLAALERPFLLAGLALVALHLLDLAFAGPRTTILGVVGIVAVPLAWAAAQPRMVRPTRIALGVVFGLLAVGFGFVAHVLHVANGGWDWPDFSGLGFFVGGLLLVASAVAAAAAPETYPFFDEIVAACVPELGAVAFTLPYYGRYAAALRARAQRLGPPWTPAAVERALWADRGGKAGARE